MRKKIFHVLLLMFSLVSVLSAAPAVWDYDGDGKTDFLIKRGVNNGDNTYQNHWYILRSRDGFFFTHWGTFRQQGCSNGGTIPGDYDGDGKYDIATPGGCTDTQQIYYYILNSSNNVFRYAEWGLRTQDRIVPQDYDGDGKTDLAVWRFGGTWYILNSSDGSFRIEQFGSLNDEPIYGDYDGDGKADLAVRRVQGSSTLLPQPITFIIKHSSTGNWQVFTMGDWRADIIVPGDYDGDGKTDMALWGGDNFEFGDGRWKWIRSSDGQFASVRYGLPGDNPVPGDYDGDGKTDLAVYRRTGTQQPQQYFYIQQSRDGFKAVPWGSSDYLDTTPMTLMNTR